MIVSFAHTAHAHLFLFCSSPSFPFPHSINPVAYQQLLSQQRGLSAFGHTPPLIQPSPTFSSRHPLSLSALPTPAASDMDTKVTRRLLLLLKQTVEAPHTSWALMSPHVDQKQVSLLSRSGKQKHTAVPNHTLTLSAPWVEVSAAGGGFAKRCVHMSHALTVAYCRCLCLDTDFFSCSPSLFL